MTTQQINALHPYFFNYDVPEGTILANPSPFMYGYGIRRQYSGWVVAERDLEALYAHFGRMEANFQRWIRETFRGITWAESAAGRRWLEKNNGRGVKWDADDFNPATAHRMIPGLIESMRADIAEKIDSARRSYGNSVADLDAEVEEGTITTRERMKRLKAFRRQMNLIVKRCNDLFEKMTKVAGRFGISMPDNIRSAEAAIKDIREAMNNRADKYHESTEMLARQLGETHELVRTARRGRIPAAILADAVDENGGNGQALRQAFNAEVLQALGSDAE